MRNCLSACLVVVLTSGVASAQSPGIREVTASERSVVTLNTKVRYTTMIILPTGEEIVDVLCGDAGNWVISATANIAHVKPAKEGAQTNLNLVGTSGAIYSFLLSEASVAGRAPTSQDLTVIDGILSNRLEGSMAGPVNVLVSTPVYSQDSTLVIPAGARVLGSAKRVEAQGETRLAVAFHRLVFPDGRDISLDSFVGMNQLGDVGLKDKVNNHYLATFGASAAVGLISGFSQWAGTGFSRNQGNSGGTVVIAGNISDAASQVTAQAMSRFINRIPTITIREGHRVAVYLTSDLSLPAYRGES